MAALQRGAALVGLLILALWAGPALAAEDPECLWRGFSDEDRALFIQDLSGAAPDPAKLRALQTRALEVMPGCGYRLEPGSVFRAGYGLVAVAHRTHALAAVADGGTVLPAAWEALPPEARDSFRAITNAIVLRMTERPAAPSRDVVDAAMARGGLGGDQALNVFAEYVLAILLIDWLAAHPEQLQPPSGT